MKSLYAFFLGLVTLFSQAEVTPLVDEMKALDSQVFASFNQCEDPQELAKHAGYFAQDVEFCHDSGGVTWDRQTMIANTEKFACGNYTRELVPDTFETYAIKDFGVITKGVHIFCQTKTKQCEGKADFLMIWHNTGAKLEKKWEITRVLSYGHRTNQ
jgi:hypothetical protein